MHLWATQGYKMPWFTLHWKITGCFPGLLWDWGHCFLWENTALQPSRSLPSSAARTGVQKAGAFPSLQPPGCYLNGNSLIIIYSQHYFYCKEMLHTIELLGLKIWSGDLSAHIFRSSLYVAVCFQICGMSSCNYPFWRSNQAQRKIP